MSEIITPESPALSTVRVPATSANLGSGFDTLGMAVNLFLTVEAYSFHGRNILDFSGEGAGTVPLDSTNLIYQSLQRYAKAVGQPLPEYSLRVENPIPLSRGLGSSGAAIVAGLQIGRALFNHKLSQSEMLELAADIEGHGDNTSASLLGGCVVCCRHDDRFLVETIMPPSILRMVAVVPEVTVSTEEARAALPQSFEMGEVVHNLQHIALLVHAMATGKIDNLGIGIDDRIHQPTRTRLVPGYDAVNAAGRDAGAVGVYLSGSGPTVMAFCREEAAIQAGDAMQAAFQQTGIESRCFQLQPVVQNSASEFSEVTNGQ
jgi:homoserine kinase